jgi:Glyoxalase-like domain
LIPDRGSGIATKPGRVRDVDLTWEQVVVDARDPVGLGRWWAEALGWVVVGDAADEFEIRPAPDQMPGLLFVPVAEGKASKNRLHPDFRPVDQAAEVDRLLSLGARLVDVGQGDASWVVLADPEGNEFCILSGRTRS